MAAVLRMAAVRSSSLHGVSWPPKWLTKKLHHDLEQGFDVLSVGGWWWVGGGGAQLPCCSLQIYQGLWQELVFAGSGGCQEQSPGTGVASTTLHNGRVLAVDEVTNCFNRAAKPSTRMHTLDVGCSCVCCRLWRAMMS